MRTIITLLTTTVLVAGITGAMAQDRQGSDEAANNSLSWRLARGSGVSGAYASTRVRSGTYGSVRVPSGAYGSARAPLYTGGIPQSVIDFQDQGRN